MRQRGVLIIGNYPPPYGGVPKHIEDLVPDLARRGWRVHVLSGGGSGVERRDGFVIHKPARPLARRRWDALAFLARSVRRGRGEILREYASLVPLSSFLSYLGRAALGGEIIEREGIDVVAGYNLASGGPVASMLGEVYDVPFVISNFGEIYSQRAVLERQRGLVRRMTERADQLLCMTRHCANSYRLLGLDPDVRIVRYGLDLEHFSPGDAGHGRTLLQLDASHAVVLFVGRMIADMGVDTVLGALPEVLREMPDTRFVIAGGRGELTADVEAAAAARPEHVRVAVDVPAERLPHLYRAADLVVVSTRGDRACGSLSAGEAMATGKPVVGARVGGVPEYVVDGETGVLVPPGDARALAAAVVRLLGEPVTLQRMGNNGLAWVRRTFDVSVTNAAMHEVFNEVMARRASVMQVAS